MRNEPITQQLPKRHDKAEQICREIGTYDCASYAAGLILVIGALFVDPLLSADPPSVAQQAQVG